MSGATTGTETGDSERDRLLEAAVARLSSARRTFTEEEALSEVWKAGYEVTPSDAGFILASEAYGRYPRQWRLATQVLANNRLLDALNVGAWDGRDIDGELERLGAEDGVRYVFCPADTRLAVRTDGAWEPAEREQNVALPAAVRAEFDALGPALLERWRTAGAHPWTRQQVTDMLGTLGWAGASETKSWLWVRAWLRAWSSVARVGQDYWAPADAVPQEPQQRRIAVLPQRGALAPPSAAYPVPHGDEEVASPLEETPVATAPAVELDMVPSGHAPPPIGATWTTTLRTAHLVGGFLLVPQRARAAYPPRAADANSTWEVVRGKWFDTNDDLWLWIERAKNLLCGPDLADKLAWCDAGQRIRVEWRPDVIVLRSLDVDREAQREETRLVDIQALAELRGGRGESYVQSLQAILVGAPDGVTFPEVVEALCARQEHIVHRGTVRALLSAGGFIHRDRRWFAAADVSVSARDVRTALVESLVPAEETEALRRPASDPKRLQVVARAIQARLRDLMRLIGAGARG